LRDERSGKAIFGKNDSNREIASSCRNDNAMAV